MYDDFEAFAGDVRKAASPVAVWDLLRVRSPERTPRRMWEANLGTFLREFKVPTGASRRELELYKVLIRTFDLGRHLVVGAADSVLADLDTAIQEPRAL